MSTRSGDDYTNDTDNNSRISASFLGSQRIWVSVGAWITRNGSFCDFKIIQQANSKNGSCCFFPPRMDYV